MRGTDALVLVDPYSSHVITTVAVPAAEGGAGFGYYAPVAEAEGGVWVGNLLEVVRVDPRTKKVAAANRTITNNPTDFAGGLGAVWAVDNGGILYRLDPRSAAVLKRTWIGSAANSGVPTAVAVVAGAVWVTDPSGNKIWRVDATGMPSGTVDVGHLPVSIAPAGGSLWVADQHDNAVAQIDPSKSTLVRTVQLRHPPVALCSEGNQLAAAVQ